MANRYKEISQGIRSDVPQYAAATERVDAFVESLVKEGGLPESLNKGRGQEVALPEPSREMLEVQRILTDNGFDVAPIVYIDRKKGEVTHAVIETVVRPDYTDGTQVYYPTEDKKDPLAGILERGRTGRKIEVPSWTRHVPTTSRFGVSWDEVHGFVAPAVVSETPHLAEAFTKGGIVLRVSTKAEFQDAGKKYPHFGGANSWEWLYDRTGLGSRLVVGHRARGGLEAVGGWRSGDHVGNVAFRLQAVSLSQKLSR